jgi:hypothetical protein
MRTFKRLVFCFMATVMVVVGLMCGSARADVSGLLQKIPNLKQGVAYSIADSKVNYIATTDIVNKWGVYLEVGYAGAAKDTGDKLIAVVSYDLVNAKKLGITIPVLDLITFRPGVYAGTGRLFGGNEFDWGISATVLDLKF